MPDFFIVAFVETDGDSFGGVSTKVMYREDAKSAARERVAEMARYYKEEHEKCGDGLEWEETLPGRYLESEKEIQRILTGMHPYFNVFVSELDGTEIDLD